MLTRNNLLSIAISAALGMLAVSRVQALPAECVIDLENSSHNCQGIPAIAFLTEPDSNHRTAVKINLDPSVSGYVKAIFDVVYGGEPEEWSVNIGDSLSNNGWAGDASHQTNNSEMQIARTSGAMTVYGSDYIPPDKTTDGHRRIMGVDGVASQGDTVTLEVADGYLSWHSPNETGELNSPYIFALNGQDDDEGPINYDIYAAFNRVIAGAYRPGSGVTQVGIRLLQEGDDECTGKHASFSIEDRKLTIPFLDAPVIDPIPQRLTDKIAVLEGELEYVAGADDFKVIADSLNFIDFAEANDPCHASVSLDGALSIPFIDVSSVILLPPDIIVPGPVETYEATFRRLPLDPYLFHLEDYLLK
ncbi:MAG: hypothetical protein GY862_04905 [Gammaproteobacteria bacterium]|nr:hypothetical protein [Gammaproteobacteria bacterium]